MHPFRPLTAFLLGAGLLAAALPVAAQERAWVPVTIDGAAVRLATITYRPAGPGPFPTLILHHGESGDGRNLALFTRRYDPTSFAGWFTDRGWAVVLPSRRGRGGSDGTYDEGFAADRAEGYSCDPARAIAGADRALADIDAVTPALLAQPFVDRTRVAVGGTSRGGVLSVAWSGRQPQVARAVVNFVGGWLGERCGSAAEVNASLFRRGGGFERPTIWLYGDRDPLFSLKHSRANFAAFREAGGTGAFHDYIPPRGVTGHQIAAAPELWTEALEAYLAGQGLPARALPVGAQAVDGNTIRIEGTTYRLWGIDAPELAQRCYPHGWRAGIEAARTLAALVDRSPAVSCEARSVDRHGRTVALCRAGGKDLGAAMVEAGMALAVVGDSDYVEQEARATLLRAGVHGHACLAPGEWRAQQRLDN